MPNRVQQQRARERSEEIAEIGPMDTKRLHQGMNKSENSKEKRAHKQPDLATGRRDGSPEGSTSRSLTSTSGSKRHASAGAGPSEPTTTTTRREMKRATTTNEMESRSSKSEAGGSKRRNDERSQVEEKPLHSAKRPSKSNT